MEKNNFIQYKFKTKHAADTFRHFCRKGLILTKRISPCSVFVLTELTGRVEAKADEIANKVSQTFDN